MARGLLPPPPPTFAIGGGGGGGGGGGAEVSFPPPPPPDLGLVKFKYGKQFTAIHLRRILILCHGIASSA